MKTNTVCIDFGGTEVKMGLFEKASLIETISYSAQTQSGFRYVLEQATEKAEELLAKHNLLWSDIKGLGLAMPGIVDSQKKQVISINEKYNDAISFDIKQWFEENMDLPFIIENDANAAILGERLIGSIGNAENAALMILGTGIGTSTIINGKLFRGAHYQGGCLGGHLIIDYQGRACNCGSIGCAEAQASTWALPEIAKLREGYHTSTLYKEKDIKIKTLVDHAQKGDVFSTKLLHEFIEKWSAVLINLVHAYDPEVIVLSGGVLQAGEIITKPLIERAQKFAWTPYGKIQIKISHHLNASVLYGLKYLVDDNERKRSCENQITTNIQSLK